jgi:hypothetical protein
MTLSAIRYDALDYLRIFGAFGIVLFHGAQDTLVRQIGYSGLIIFVLISIFVSLQNQSNKSIAQFIVSRTPRILVPWLFWFFVYGIINIIIGKPFLPGGGITFSALLAGTNIILWYLPFIFLMSIIAFVYDQTSENITFIRKYRLIPFLVLSILSLISTPVWRPWSLSLGNPWAQWFHALPAVFIGMTLAYLHNHSSHKYKMSLYASIIILTSVWLIMIGQFDGVAIPYLVGTILFIVSIFVIHTSQNNGILMNISNSAYGIYLIHPIVYGVEYKLGFSENAALPVITFVLSLLIILMAKRIPIGFVQKVI